MEDILNQLKYSECDCPIDYKKDLGVVNGICPNHRGSVLLVNGKKVNALIEAVKKLDKKTSEII